MKYDPTMLNIGREKQLLLDDLLIEVVENVRRTWHQPKKLDNGPLIKSDKPWENVLVFHCNTWQVIRDPRDGLFKLWYSNLKLPALKSGELVFGKSTWCILYAQSQDGISWHKPLFDIHRIDNLDTNVVLPDASVPGLILDEQETDPKKRFKMVSNQQLPGQDCDNVVAATSADGIYWDVSEQPLSIGRHGSHLDDNIVLHYDPLARVYVITTRHYDMYAVSRNLKNPATNTFGPPYYPMDWSRMNKRRVWQSESADFTHWSEPYPVLTPDEDDNFDEAYGGLCKYQVGDLTIGLLESMCLVPNTMHVRLACSRDGGRTWRHLNNRQPFMLPGGEGTWDAYGATIPSKPIIVDDELWVYYGGSSCHHDWWITGAREGLKVPEATDISLAKMGLGLAKLRLDGFASLDAGPARLGIFITRPFISDGSRLLINARCKNAGSIAAEVVDVNDDVVAGFSRQDCDLFTGDSVKHTFSWRGQKGTPVWATERAVYPEPERQRFRKIRFFMENAELYSFTLE